MKTTLGLVVGNRGFFPARLCEEGRAILLKVLEREGLDVVTLDPGTTPYGSVETHTHARTCAELFKANRERIDGILVSLPNFGDERGVADSIRLAGLDVPVLVHAFPDSPQRMDIEHRRDSFCGKMSCCNNLRQYGIRYSLTARHTVDPESREFAEDLARFAAVCRVVRGLRKARFGQVGARPAAFLTVRYSEKILELCGISVESLDLSEAFGRAEALKDGDPALKAKLEAISRYVKTRGVPAAALEKMARFGVVMDRFVEDNALDGTAVQCWTSMEQYFGVVPCAVMSMASQALKPSACETDVTGLVGMYAMVLASGRPSALLDWNNNYGAEDDKAVVFHCSNLPQELFGGEATMDYQAIIAGSVGRENAYGTIVGQIKPTEFTYCRLSTDDACGLVRGYVGEGRVGAEKLDTFGGYGVVHIPGLQKLLRYICANGFEHHVAVNPARVAGAVHEAMEHYLGWQIYRHEG
jgi:L-fucose isomerase-like protein